MNKTPEIYDQWNEQKKKVEFRLWNVAYVDVWDIRRYYEWVNIGNELSKDGLFLRPCIVLQNNMNNGLVCIAALTTKFKEYTNSGSIDIIHTDKYWLKPSRVLINQIRHIDKKRFKKRISLQKIPQWFVNKILYMYHYLLTKNTT